MSEDVLSRAAPPPDTTRRYAAEPAHVYDVRLPPPAAPQRPGTVLVVHGGFWRAAYDRSHTGPQAAGLADAGWHVAVGEYRRTGMPGGGVPGTLDDIAALVRAVAADPELPGPLVLVGHSAGGHLVAWTASQPWAADLLAGVVALAGCVDLALTDELGLGNHAARDFLGGAPDRDPQAWRAADPAEHLPPLVPVRMVHGSADVEVPVSVSEQYLRKATAAGGDVGLDVVEGAGHYDVIDPESPAWPHVLAAVEAACSSGV